MKTIRFILISIFAACLFNCTNKDSAAPDVKKGSLLFWTNNPSTINNCGVLTVTCNNQQSNITGYYYVAPVNCVNQFGGYFYISEGKYNYTITSGNPACSFTGGSVTVIGDQCNFVRTQ